MRLAQTHAPRNAEKNGVYFTLLRQFFTEIDRSKSLEFQRRARVFCRRAANPRVTQCSTLAPRTSHLFPSDEHYATLSQASGPLQIISPLVSICRKVAAARGKCILKLKSSDDRAIVYLSYLYLIDQIGRILRNRSPLSSKRRIYDWKCDFNFDSSTTDQK